MKPTILLSEQNRRQQVILTAMVGVAVNVLLSTLKVYIGISANSLSILTDGLNNAVDTLSFLIIILSFYVMKKPATEELPFGYGRLEYLAGFVMSILVVTVGFYFAYSALERMFYPYLLTFTWLNFAFIAVSIPVKVLLAFFFRRRNRSLNSDVIKTCFMDSIMDAGITLMTIVGFSLAQYASLRLDAILGLAISVIIIINGIKLLFEHLKRLLGKRTDIGTEEEIRAYLAELPELSEIGGFSLHDYGKNYMELVIELSFTNDCNFDTMGKVAECIKATLAERYHVKAKICIMR